MVDNRVQRKRRREPHPTEHNILSDLPRHAGTSADACAALEASAASSKAPRRRTSHTGASGRLFGALFKGQLQAAKQTLDSKPQQEKLAAQAAARAAAEAAEAETLTSLAQAERTARAAQLSTSQARKRVMEATVMASRWKAHYGTLASGEYLATEAQPALFWKPAKPNAASLKGLLHRRKHSHDAMVVQQPLWDEFVAQEKRAVASLLQQCSPSEEHRVVLVQQGVPQAMHAAAAAGSDSEDGEVAEAELPASPAQAAGAGPEEVATTVPMPPPADTTLHQGAAAEAAAKAVTPPQQNMIAKGGSTTAPPSLQHTGQDGVAEEEGAGQEEGGEEEDASAAVAALLDDDEDDE